MSLDTVTFDFWNTLFSDGGTAFEVLSARRCSLLLGALEDSGLKPSESEVQQAYRAGFSRYLEAWQQGIHYGAAEQTAFVFELFQVRPAAELLTDTVRAVEEAGVDLPIQPTAGAREIVALLSGLDFKLGVVSDTGLTPGRILREFLAREGMLDFFVSLTFSDETGFTKPDPRMFRRTLAPLGSLPQRAAHVGDRPGTDIAGALAVGMYAIRYAAVEDHPEPPLAHAVITQLRELPAALAEVTCTSRLTGLPASRSEGGQCPP